MSWLSPNGMLNQGLVQLPFDSEAVEDADEEVGGKDYFFSVISTHLSTIVFKVFLIYTALQQGSSETGTSQGCRGLGYVDSYKDIISVQFELSCPVDTAVKRSKRAQNSKRSQQRVRDKVVEIELAQDTTALRSRKGDTGSVLWMARYVFVLQRRGTVFDNMRDLRMTGIYAWYPALNLPSSSFSSITFVWRRLCSPVKNSRTLMFSNLGAPASVSLLYGRHHTHPVPQFRNRITEHCSLPTGSLIHCDRRC